MTDAMVPQSSDSPSTSLTLLELARNGDKAAWDALVDLYYPLVWGWCRSRNYSESAAEEIGQNVFTAVLTSLGNFHKVNPGDTFRGWLRQITIHKCADWTKDATKQPIAPGGSDWIAVIHEVPAKDDDEEQISAEIQFLYERAVRAIENEYSELHVEIFMEVVKGRPPNDIALEFNVKVNVVSTVKSRIRKRLREKFGETLPEFKEFVDSELSDTTTPKAEDTN